jgi:hypothetical protein
MNPGFFVKYAILPSFKLLPSSMRNIEACAFILAICLQESELKSRRQIGGPARGYAQFELSGIRGILAHPKTTLLARTICFFLDVPVMDVVILRAMEYNDILTSAFSRLLIWTHPDRLPKEGESELAWKQYLELWRPGKPRIEPWASNFSKAWEITRIYYESQSD